MILFHKHYRILGSLGRAPDSVLILDYDGTIAPFRVERDEALPYSGVCSILDAIMETERSRVIIVSGRPVDKLVPLLRLKRLPEVWGSHGWERRWPDGRYACWKASDRALQGLAEADAAIEQKSLTQYCEQKPGSIALHWRGLPESEKSRVTATMMKDWKLLAVKYGLEIRNFDGGLELRAPGRNKGDVVRTLIQEFPEGTFMAYLGDDLTDEDAFGAIDGHGVGILVRKEKRPSRARLHLRPPGELLEFLQWWHEMTKPPEKVGGKSRKL